MNFDLGNFIKEKRKELGITQQELADISGVGINFVYQLEKNKPTVRLDTTRMVLNALGYDITVEKNITDDDKL